MANGTIDNAVEQEMNEIFENAPILYRTVSYLAHTIAGIQVCNITIMIIVEYFMVNNIVSKNSTMRSPYFALIVIGATYYILFTIVEILAPVFLTIKIYYRAIELHYVFFTGIWFTFMSFNRFTAVILWRHMKILWTPKLTILYILFVFIFPILMMIPVANSWNCIFDRLQSSECRHFRDWSIYASDICDGVSTVVSAFFCLSADLVSRFGDKSQNKVSAQIRKAENNLLIQTSFFTTFYVLHSLMVFVSSFFLPTLTLLISMYIYAFSEIIRELSATSVFVPFIVCDMWKQKLYQELWVAKVFVKPSTNRMKNFFITLPTSFYLFSYYAVMVNLIATILYINRTK